MSKKRKTRKQKEHAHERQPERQQVSHVHIDTPTYTVAGLKTTSLKSKTVKDNNPTTTTVEESDKKYLKRDISAITAASGIIVAFDILLFVLLSTGTVKLNFLGY